MNSSQQPPEFIKDPEETDSPTWASLFGSDPDYPTGEPTLFEAIADAWKKSYDQMSPERKQVHENFKKNITDPITYVELSVMIVSLALLKRKRGWSRKRTVLWFLLANEAYSAVRRPEEAKLAYKVMIGRK